MKMFEALLLVLPLGETVGSTVILDGLLTYSANLRYSECCRSNPIHDEMIGSKERDEVSADKLFLIFRGSNQGKAKRGLAETCFASKYRRFPDQNQHFQMTII